MEQQFIEAVNSHDLISVRIKIANAVLNGTDKDTLCEMINFADNQLSDLYEEHDGEVFDDNITNISDDIIAKISNKLNNYNFSKERLDYFIKVNEKVTTNKTKYDIFTKSKSTITVGDYIVSSCLIIGGGIIVADGVLTCRMLPIVAGSFITAAGVVKIINDTVKKNSHEQ